MSFLRNIRNNLTGSDRGTTRTPSKPVKPARSSLGSTLNRNGESDYGTTTTRRNSGVNGNRRSSTAATSTLRREDKYGKENPAPIIVYVDKYETVKKPAGILRNNTFTKGDREQAGRRQSAAITRSDTFTIQESEDEKQKTSTYTRKKKGKDKSQENLYESRENDQEDPEKLPVVFDSRTYRKKSLKSSKPVQKVESFIKRVEKSLFKHDSKKNGRKDSNSSEGSYVPKFRDIGINCKLDDEDRMRTTRKKRGSRDSLLDTTNLEHSSSSQRSYRERSTTPQVKPRDRSTSPTKRYATFDRKETRFERDSSPVPPEKPKRTHGRERSISPFETLELKSKSVDNSYLKARQKEIEMGYSQSTSKLNRKPVGIASPRAQLGTAPRERSASPTKQTRKDSAELPKYTFGTNLQERRSRFQEFQKSFKKMDGDEVQVQQSFFVPI
ncbi:conserved hypothetical protein [Culex quinquefasciatus]|uniref:Uncharacterized protein n=1 Tax=Culex quinquefasciatus TaxID=7176 RepID=B0XL70_CULQU|nr:conserved hypothetical protein [Culex quinquefasciatus]|eukprot:XP_001870392.1 conserved hypothetical protein [Culex quinquefasciatus]